MTLELVVMHMAEGTYLPQNNNLYSFCECEEGMT
jgi:hypothetical protein